MEKVLHKIFGLSRLQKRVISVCIDYIALFAACVVALAIRLAGTEGDWSTYWLAAAIAPITCIPPMALMGTYRAVIRYMTSEVAVTVVKATGIGVALWVVALALLEQPVPRSVIFIYWVLAAMFVSLTRLAFRWLVRRSDRLSLSSPVLGERAVAAIYGTGPEARKLFSTLATSTTTRVVVFVSLDGSLIGRDLLGVPVISDKGLEKAVQAYGIAQVLLAQEFDDSQAKQKLIARLEHLAIGVKTIPNIDDIAAGRARTNELSDLSIGDLLHRQSVAPDAGLIAANICGKVVMVTGAGGSIGSELARQALAQRPLILVLFEQSEYALYAIEAELNGLKQAQGLNAVIVAALGSVRDADKVEETIRRHGVDTIYHAAAYKHVPLVEENPLEGLKNNVLGTWVTANAAEANGVETFVLVSTDKAVRPTNVMGASKRLAELCVQALARAKRSSLRYSAVRFGNVLGSSGSVVPKFRQQIADGGPVTLTSTEITRYFMTIPEAAQLVIQAGAMGGNGELYVLDMGEPVKILELALRMVRLSGHVPRLPGEKKGDIEIKVTGLRPGEKLYEELLISGDVNPTQHEKIFEAADPAKDYLEIKAMVASVENWRGAADRERVFQQLVDWSGHGQLS